MVKLIAASFAPLLLVILLHLEVAPAAQADLRVWVYNCNSTDGNYTSSSTYKTNLDSLLTKTTTTNIDYGFYNFSAGKSSNMVSLISLCLGNIIETGCHACQKVVMGKLTDLCPNQKTAIAWSDDCVVRYSKHSIFGMEAKDPGFLMLRQQKASDDTLEEYSNAVKTLLEGLPGNASAGDSRLKFASGQADFNSSATIYAAAQCTPDLNQKQCLDCLNDASNVIQSCSDCKGQRGARALLPSCMVRFEEYKFYLSTTDAPVRSPSPSPSLSPSPDAPVPSTSPSLSPSTSQSPSPRPGDAVVPSATAPSGNSSMNAAGKEKIGSRSSIVAIAVVGVGACLSALL